MEGATVYRYSRRTSTTCELLLGIFHTSLVGKGSKMEHKMLFFVINCTEIQQVHLKELWYLNLSGVCVVFIILLCFFFNL